MAEYVQATIWKNDQLYVKYVALNNHQNPMKPRKTFYSKSKEPGRTPETYGIHAEAWNGAKHSPHRNSMFVVHFCLWLSEFSFQIN